MARNRLGSETAFELVGHGISFLSFDGKISYEERMNVAAQAIFMFYEGERKRRIREEKFEGFVELKKHGVVLGSDVGAQYNAVLDTQYGTSKLSVIVCDRMNRGSSAWN